MKQALLKKYALNAERVRIENWTATRFFKNEQREEKIKNR